MPYISGKYYPLRRLIFFSTEGCVIFFALLLMQRIFLGQALFSEAFTVSVLRAGLVTVVFQLSLYFFDLYDLNVYSSFPDTATGITQAFGVGCIALAVFYYLFPEVIIPQGIFWTGYLLICAVLAAWRFFYVFALRRQIFAEAIVVLGTGELAAEITHEIIDNLDSGYKIVAYVGLETPTFNTHGAPIYPNRERSIADICREHKADMVVVALEDRRGIMPVKELIDCKLDGVEIVKGVGFLEKLTGKLIVAKVNPSWIIYSPGFSISRLNIFLKRFFDLVLSLLGLLLASPLMLISALIIKLESPGPIFYRQERVGAHGASYWIIKFRSMGQDAEKDGAAVWASKNDSRVTRFGGFIRRMRIDELPQLWNVLKADMSFVGPRPERPVFVKDLAQKIPYYSLRHNIKPGVTGWAQICYPYGASEEDALRKLEYDLYYLKNLSLAMDLWIVFQTVKTVLFQKGSR